MEEKYNIVQVGEITISSKHDPIDKLIRDVNTLLKNPDVKNYLGIAKKKKINSYLG